MTHKILRVCATAFLIAAAFFAASGQEKPAATIGPAGSNESTRRRDRQRSVQRANTRAAISAVPAPAE